MGNCANPKRAAKIVLPFQGNFLLNIQRLKTPNNMQSVYNIDLLKAKNAPKLTIHKNKLYLRRIASITCSF